MYNIDYSFSNYVNFGFANFLVLDAGARKWLYCHFWCLSCFSWFYLPTAHPPETDYFQKFGFKCNTNFVKSNF